MRGLAVVKMKYYEKGRSQDELLKIPCNYLAFLLTPKSTGFNDTLIHCVLDLVPGLPRMAHKINGKTLISCNKFMEENHLPRPLCRMHLHLGFN